MISQFQINMTNQTNSSEYQTLLNPRSTPTSRRATDMSRSLRCGFPPITFVIMTVLLLSSMLLSIVVVRPGEVAVVVTLGHIAVLPPGARLRIPFVSYVDRMSTKTQLMDQINTIPTKEGLTVQLEAAVLYRIEPTKIEELYRTVGINYDKVLIEPEIASSIRGFTSESEAKALYTSGRTDIQEAVKGDLVKNMQSRGIIIEAVLLKDVQLPQELSKSIELKAKAEQDAARMEFILAKERQEAERKSIEATGIAKFQQIVTEGISPNLLKWKGIEATEKIAESTNSKIIIIGNNVEGLPVLFSGDDAR